MSTCVLRVGSKRVVKYLRLASTTRPGGMRSSEPAWADDGLLSAQGQSVPCPPRLPGLQSREAICTNTAGFSVTGVHLVRTSNGAITVPAAVPSPAASGGSGGISGGAIAGSTAGAVVLLLVAGAGCRLTPPCRVQACLDR